MRHAPMRLRRRVSTPSDSRQRWQDSFAGRRRGGWSLKPAPCFRAGEPPRAKPDSDSRCVGCGVRQPHTHRLWLRHDGWALQASWFDPERRLPSRQEGHLPQTERPQHRMLQESGSALLIDRTISSARGTRRPRWHATNHADAMRLAGWLLDQGYHRARVLDDGSVAAVQHLIYTRAILLGCHWQGWSARFCFADRALALQRYRELRSEDDVPAGYVARR